MPVSGLGAIGSKIDLSIRKKEMEEEVGSTSGHCIRVPSRRRKAQSARSDYRRQIQNSEK